MNDFKGEQIHFGSVVKLLQKTLKEPKNLFIEHETKGPFEKPYVLLLMCALSVDKGPDYVKNENVVTMMNWLDQLDTVDCLPSLYTLFIADYFFGVYESDEEVKKYFHQAKPGDYCVYWNTNSKTFVAMGIPKHMEPNQKELKVIPLNAVTLTQLNDILTSAFLKELNFKNAVAGKPDRLKNIKLKEYEYHGADNYIRYPWIARPHFYFIQ